MKPLRLLTLAFVFALTILCARAGFLHIEDAIGKDYWQSLDAKSQTVFLTAYRHTRGPVHDMKAEPEFVVLQTKHFPALIAKLDKFYKIAENSNVFLKAAIEICFMEMSGKPQADIDLATKKGRDAISEY